MTPRNNTVVRKHTRTLASGPQPSLLLRRPQGGRRHLGIASVLVVLLLCSIQISEERASAYAGSGYSNGGYSVFCSEASLWPYGAGGDQYTDRCAYGWFSGANQVQNQRGASTPPIRMCAGMKSNNQGGGNNVGPVGYSCSGSGVTNWASPYAGDTTGYMTIGNRDDLLRNAFYGYGWY